jgi:hypothetical protein
LWSLCTTHELFYATLAVQSVFTNNSWQGKEIPTKEQTK